MECPSCGEEGDFGKFCSNCGTLIENRSEQKKPLRREAPAKRKVKDEDEMQESRRRRLGFRE